MFIVTEELHGIEEYAEELDSRLDLLDHIDNIIDHIPDGGAIVVRRADYLDTKTPAKVMSEGRRHGHLTVYDGGKK